MKKAVLINDTSTKPHLGCRLVVSRIAKMAADAGIRLSATASVHTDWRRHEDLKREMREADVVIVNGEGTLHDSTPPARALAGVGPFCRKAGVPSVLINSVYQNNDDALAEDCRSFERIFVRETISAAFARGQGLQVEVVPDLTLTSDVMVPFADAPRNNIIVVTDNANRALSAATIDAALALSHIAFLNLNTHEAQNFFMPASLVPDRTFFNGGPSKGLSYENRSGWSRALKAGMRDFSHPIRRATAAKNLARTRPAMEILRGIATCKGLVAGRFHAMCLSMLVGTPFVAMPSNTLKTQGLLVDAGLVHRLVEDPAEALRQAGSWSETDHDLAASFVIRARSEASAMFQEIASLAR